jgi:uroporphyrinogen decarboxylase
MAVTPPFLAALRREPTTHTPVWFMRQAGRYMAEYRALRERYSLLDICAEPDLAAEVTLQPIRALGVDAAIIFADILLPLDALGLGLRFAQGEGPVIERPIRAPADVAALPAVEAREVLGNVGAAIALVRAALTDGPPVIGFAGAPFTVASYAIEGGSTRQFIQVKRFMYEQPSAWHALMERLVEFSVGYLTSQVEGGAQALQIFDSWVGVLDGADYTSYVLPHQRVLFDRLRGLAVPTIHFGVGAAHLLQLQRDAGGDAIGLDWRTPLDEGWAIVGHDRAIQGNLDPVVLFAPWPEVERRIDAMLDRAAGRPGHVFNLGHGILPGTPVETVRRVVDHVHARTAR